VQLRHLIPALLVLAAVAAVTIPQTEPPVRPVGAHAATPADADTFRGRQIVLPRRAEHAARPDLPPRSPTSHVATRTSARRAQATQPSRPRSATPPVETRSSHAEPADPPPPAPLAITDVQVDPARESAVRVSWRTTVPARDLTAVGIDEPAIWGRSEGEPAVAHESVLDGLEPGRAYRVYLHAVDAWGRAASATVPFTTGPPPDASRAGIDGDDIVVDGRAFFPTAVWQQCSDALGANIDEGINTFIGLGCGGADVDLARLLGGRAYALVDSAEADAPGRGLVGWYYPDEWDAFLDGSVKREELRRAVARPHPGRISFLTLTNHFYSRAEPLPQGKGMYPALLSLPDVVGFDLYPLQGWCRPAFGDVFDAQRELDTSSGGKPTFQWLEVAAMEQACGRDRALDPTPTTVRAETWLAIAGGADGIGYFPNRWGGSIGAEIAQTNRAIRALAPALAADDLPARPDTDAVRAAARSLNDALYVIVVNTTASVLNARITVDGIAGRSGRVYGSEETVGAEDSGFTDTFGPLAARVYVFPPSGW
jgi:hypothetical protein